MQIFMILFHDIQVLAPSREMTNLIDIFRQEGNRQISKLTKCLLFVRQGSNLLTSHSGYLLGQRP
jgi:hypothetical protein